MPPFQASATYNKPDHFIYPTDINGMRGPLSIWTLLRFCCARPVNVMVWYISLASTSEISVFPSQ